MVTQFTDKLRTTEGARKLGPGPDSDADKALRIFVTLVRDREVGGSNPLAPDQVVGAVPAQRLWSASISRF